MKYRTYLKCRIVFTSLFLIISTIVWFNRDTNLYHQVDSNLESSEVILSNFNKEVNFSNYTLNIKNKDNNQKDYKVYLISDIMKNNISNNFIKYQVNDDSIKTLNMDGMIIIDKIEGNSSKDINLKFWISETYNGNLSYDGRIIVS